jgi:hypothetical protein
MQQWPALNAFVEKFAQRPAVLEALSREEVSA